MRCWSQLACCSRREQAKEALTVKGREVNRKNKGKVTDLLSPQITWGQGMEMRNGRDDVIKVNAAGMLHLTDSTAKTR